MFVRLINENLHRFRDVIVLEAQTKPCTLRMAAQATGSSDDGSGTFPKCQKSM